MPQRPPFRTCSAKSTVVLATLIKLSSEVVFRIQSRPAIPLFAANQRRDEVAVLL